MVKTQENLTECYKHLAGWILWDSNDFSHYRKKKQNKKTIAGLFWKV